MTMIPNTFSYVGGLGCGEYCKTLEAHSHNQQPLRQKNPGRGQHSQVKPGQTSTLKSTKQWFSFNSHSLPQGAIFHAAWFSR